MGLYDITIINAIGGNKLSCEYRTEKGGSKVVCSLENEADFLVI